MRKIRFTLTATVMALAMAGAAYARDDKHLLSIKAAMDLKDTEEKLDGSVKFFFGDQKPPAVLKKLGNFVSNKKTNAVGKSDERACNWAFLSALVALEKRAQKEGGNAVINIVSYYDRKTMESSTEFECHAGNVVAGVVLKGDVVTIAK